MKNQEIATIFDSIASMMELLGENNFRINSYRNAARALQELTEDVERMDQKQIKEIPGIGDSTALKILEYCQTGKMTRYEELRAKLPPELPQLLRLPGLGPKTIAKLWKQADITSLAELRTCLEGDRQRLMNIAGLGEKKIEQMTQSLAFVETSGGRVLLGDADRIARGLIESISACPGACRVVAAGSLRRGRETVGDIDLLCEAPQEFAPAIIEQFTRSPLVKRVLAKGDTKGSALLAQDVQADIRVVPTESFGAALAYFTGSKAHNVTLRERAVKRKLKLNEYGLFQGDQPIAGHDEQGVYQALGLPYIEPQLREDRGEIEAAQKGTLPELVNLDDIRGDFQMHTNQSDGVNTLQEMVQACRKLGYHAMAITDHSVSEHQANGLTVERLLEQIKAIRKAARQYDDILLLAGCEVDILKDGRLDYDDEVLAQLDFVLAAPHAALTLTGQAATDRIIKAIENPFVHCIAHPTGRIVNGRAGMEFDMDAVAKAAAAHDVALEINADFHRLDLRDTHVRVAIERGCKIMINTDAHGLADLGQMMPYGVITARRGWATRDAVINTWPRERIAQWLRAKTQKAAAALTHAAKR